MKRCLPLWDGIPISNNTIVITLHRHAQSSISQEILNSVKLTINLNSRKRETVLTLVGEGNTSQGNRTPQRWTPRAADSAESPIILCAQSQTPRSLPPSHTGFSCVCLGSRLTLGCIVSPFTFQLQALVLCIFLLKTA